MEQANRSVEADSGTVEKRPPAAERNRPVGPTATAQGVEVREIAFDRALELAGSTHAGNVPACA